MKLATWPCQQPSRLFFPTSMFRRTVDACFTRKRQLSASVLRAVQRKGPIPKDAAVGHIHARPSKGKPLRVITTLDPKRLDPGCFMDLSGVGLPLIYASFLDGAHSVVLRPHYATERRGHKHFPAGTHGFLYYCADLQSPLRSQLRFRVTEDSNPASFSHGHDLTYDQGYPWHLALGRVASRHSRENLYRLLLRDGFIDENIVTDLHNVDRLCYRRSRRSISSLRQPFVLDLSIKNQRILVRAAEPISQIGLRSLIKNIPYEEGIVVCRLERSTLPEHAGRRVVVMRLLKILKPPKLVPDLPLDIDLTFPVEGELMMKNGRPWCSNDVDSASGSRALQTLCDADEGQEPGQS